MKRLVFVCSVLAALAVAAYADLAASARKHGVDLSTTRSNLTQTGARASFGAPAEAREAAVRKSALEAEVQALQVEAKRLTAEGGDAKAVYSRLSELYRELHGAAPAETRQGTLDQGNENCPATLISSLPYTDTGSTVGLVSDFGCDGNTAGDVVYEYTAQYNGTYTFSLCGSNYDTRLEVRAGSCPGTDWLCNDDTFDCGLQSIITTHLNYGDVVTVVVDGYWYNVNEGNYTLNASVVIDVPANDACGSATAVNEGSYPFSTVNSTTDGPDEPGVCTAFGYSHVENDVWFAYTATCTGTATVDVCGANYDSKIAVYGAACPTGASAFVCNDDFCGLQSQVSFAVWSGSTYYIRIGGYVGNTGSGTLTIATSCNNDNCADAVEIPCPVTDVMVDLGSATMDCPSNGYPEYWYKVYLDPQISECWNLTLNYCGTDPNVYEIGANFRNDCACDDFFGYTGFSGTTCPDINWLPDEIYFQNMPAGWWYLPIYAGGAAWVMFDLSCEPCQNQSCVECPEGARHENEECYLPGPDVVNGGCNGQPPLFSDLSCNDVVCGLSESRDQFQDLDWYQITIAERESLTVCLHADFASGMALVAAGPTGCEDGLLLQVVYGAACEPYCLSACLEPGIYWVVVLPNSASPVACGHYVLSTHCQPCADHYICDCMRGPDTHCNMAGGAINDLSTQDFVINVPVQYAITDVDVCLDLVHTFDGDLVITLISPLGTQVILSANHGGGGDNYSCTSFDDEAATAIGAGAAPFFGAYTPDQALAAFDGENAFGNWILRIADVYGADVGWLNWACVNFEYDDILAVELAGDFTATAGDGRVTLAWATQSETDNARFEIVRDGRIIGLREGAGTSAARHEYHYTDVDLDNGRTYRYSLVAVNTNGEREEVATAQATPSFTAAAVTEYALHQNYPNPFNPTTQIRFDLVDAGFVTLRVYNLMGQEVATLVNGQLPAGAHAIGFDAAGLPSGVYLYRLTAGSYAAEMKMLLMK